MDNKPEQIDMPSSSQNTDTLFQLMTIAVIALLWTAGAIQIAAQFV